MSQNSTRQSIAADCNTIAKFLARRDLPTLSHQAIVEVSGVDQADLLILLGSAVLDTLEVTGRAYRKNLAKNLLISGGLGHSTNYLVSAVNQDNRPTGIDLSGRPEAEILADLLELWYGADRNRILLETESTNCGDNALKSLQLVEDRNIEPRHVVLVQDPTMQLRSHASFQKVWMKKQDVTFYSYAPFVPQVSVVDGQLELASQINGKPLAWDIERFITLLLGEIPRLRDDARGYGPAGKNYIVHIDIPNDVAAAYQRLHSWVEDYWPSVAQRMM